jgi:rubrerythrin
VCSGKDKAVKDLVEVSRVFEEQCKILKDTNESLRRENERLKLDVGDYVLLEKNAREAEETARDLCKAARAELISVQGQLKDLEKVHSDLQIAFEHSENFNAKNKDRIFNQRQQIYSLHKKYAVWQEQKSELEAELQGAKRIAVERLRCENEQSRLAGNALNVADVALLLVEQQQEQLQVSQQAIREARERDIEMQEMLHEIHRFYPAEILSALIDHQRGMLRTAAITAKSLEQEAGAAEVAGLKQQIETAKALNIAIQHECNVCMQADPDCHWACFRPCGHVGTCWNCAEPLDKCPMCQEPKKSLVIARR